MRPAGFNGLLALICGNHAISEIFQEFFRADDSLTSRVKGTGLGLTIARKIARDLGGDVICAARAGGGSDFAVRLPAAEDKEGPR